MAICATNLWCVCVAVVMVMVVVVVCVGAPCAMQLRKGEERKHITFEQGVLY